MSSWLLSGIGRSVSVFASLVRVAFVAGTGSSSHPRPVDAPAASFPVLLSSVLLTSIASSPLEASSVSSPLSSTAQTCAAAPACPPASLPGRRCGASAHEPPTPALVLRPSGSKAGRLSPACPIPSEASVPSSRPHELHSARGPRSSTRHWPRVAIAAAKIGTRHTSDSALGASSARARNKTASHSSMIRVWPARAIPSYCECAAPRSEAPVRASYARTRSRCGRAAGSTPTRPHSRCSNLAEHKGGARWSPCRGTRRLRTMPPTPSGSTRDSHAAATRTDTERTTRRPSTARPPVQ